MSKKGNQTGYELDQDAEIVYNPGFADNGEAPTRDPLLAPNTSQDISKSAKVTLGNYLSAASTGQVGASRSNSFRIPGNSVSTDGSAYEVSVAASSRISGGDARRQMESAGSTIGSFLDLTKGYGSTAPDKFNALKDSDYGRGDNPFTNTDIKRVGSDERRKGSDGNTIFSGIKSTDSATSVDLGAPQINPAPDDAPVVQKKISEVLLRNRFNPIEKAFVENHTRQVPGGYTIQKKMGVYTQGVDAPEVDEKKLKEVGLNLLVRATGHGVPGADLLDPTNSLQQFSNLAPLIPSISQFTGLPLIDVVNLRAGNIPLTDQDATSNPSRSEYINPENPDMDVFAGKSYGVLNSHFEPFDGPFPIGTLVTTVAGILAIVGFSAIFGAFGLLAGQGFNSGMKNVSSPMDLKMGRRGLITDDSTQDFFFELFNIPKTDHNWGECVFVGLGAFLGFGGTIGNGVTAETILEGAFNLAMAPGYYAVIIRNAVRDTQQVVTAVENFASNIVNTNVVLAIQNFFKIVESITTSATFRFVMAMVNIGNQVLNGQQDMTLYVDTLPNVAENRHKKSRVGNGKSDDVIPILGSPGGFLPHNLAWRHASAPSRYLLPESFRKSSALINGGTTRDSLRLLSKVSYEPNGSSIPKLPDGSDTSARIGAENRLPAQYVQEIEDKLESEYMPFYFHDLRTNEIISFHAFLSDLSDGFTAAYTSTAGYGRAEEVMTYNNTKRSISFTFTVAATSEDDHAAMYWNINKLVTMLYPQYSRGRGMQSGNDKFIQPFSQIPTASPMIRLRIGDVVKSNYSRFGIARLFGLGQSESVFNMHIDPPAAPASTTSPAARTGVPTAREQAEAENRVRASERDRATAGYRPAASGAPADKVFLRVGTYNWVNNNGTRAARREVPNLTKRYTNAPEVEIVQVIPTPNSVPAATDLSPAAAAGSRAGARRRPRRNPTSPNLRYIVKISESDAPSVNEQWRYHEIAHADIVALTQQSVDALLARELASASRTTPAGAPAAPASSTSTSGSPSTNSTPNYQRLTNFLDGSQNPVIRSFESALGRGLAGFITDLKFDWNEAPWEIKRGSRAPIFMKVSVSFTPIHDIPMGLDSDGMMRSVPYNVGTLSNAINGDPYKDYQTVSQQEREAAAQANRSTDSTEPNDSDESTVTG